MREPVDKPRPLDHPLREIRATFSDESIVVYQAFSPEIAEPALAAGRFVSPFKLGRMTWIKPSFLWMMYRSGWATKPGQERILAVSISRDGFEWALAHCALSHYDPAVHRSRAEWERRLSAAPVRVQWDPERSLSLAPLGYRAIQVGLSGEAAHAYVRDWLNDIEDITALAREVCGLVASGELAAAREKLPVERAYPLPDSIRAVIGASAAACETSLASPGSGTEASDGR